MSSIVFSRPCVPSTAGHRWQLLPVQVLSLGPRLLKESSGSEASPVVPVGAALLAFDTKTGGPAADDDVMTPVTGHDLRVYALNSKALFLEQTPSTLALRAGYIGQRNASVLGVCCSCLFVCIFVCISIKIVIMGPLASMLMDTQVHQTRTPILRVTQNNTGLEHKETNYSQNFVYRTF